MPFGSHRRREARLGFAKFYYKVESNKYVAKAGQAIHEQSLSMSEPGTARDIRRTTNEVYETSLLTVEHALQAEDERAIRCHAVSLMNLMILVT